MKDLNLEWWYKMYQEESDKETVPKILNNHLIEEYLYSQNWKQLNILKKTII